MYWTDNTRIDKYTDRFGSIYAATAYIAAEARKRADDCNDRISHSEALSWVITGEQPASLKKLTNQSKNRNYVTNYIEEVLTYVDNKDVCECVRLSLQESQKFNHLIYVYTYIDDGPNQARVRVLTRKLWYELQLMNKPY